MPRRTAMDVREIMTSPAFTIGAEDTLNCAAKLMREHALGCLPVVNDDGKLTGIITDRDIALGAHEYGEALWRLRIADSMHIPVYTCHADDDLEVAVKLMR